tara:strand:- start:391 stop:1023 length:633 start_codon:yes stop_codon:yes gene_type:complete
MTTLSLFPEDNIEPELPPGLIYTPEFITPTDEERLLHKIDNQQWLDELIRRVQHYGYKYNYKARKIDHSMYLGALPNWIQDIANAIQAFIERDESTHGVEAQLFDQAIVNEYLPGQGISAHIDCEPCFGDIITTLSLGSDTQMQFDLRSGGDSLHVPLARRSLAILTGPSRYEWLHSINNRKSDTWPVGTGPKVSRSRRVSITFRSVNVK